MSACDTCPKPGNCCNDFVLNGVTVWTRPLRFHKDSWEEGAFKYMRDQGMPFQPLRIDERFPEQDGEVGVRWMCPVLTPAGRCGDYDNRPQLCRDYQPGDDRLCVLYVEPPEGTNEAKL